MPGATAARRLNRIKPEVLTAMEPTRNLPHARYRRFEGMREVRGGDRRADSADAEPHTRFRPVAEPRLQLAGPTRAAAPVPPRQPAEPASHRAARHRQVRPPSPAHAPAARSSSREAVSIRETLRPAKHLYDPFVIFDASHYRAPLPLRPPARIPWHARRRGHAAIAGPLQRNLGSIEPRQWRRPSAACSGRLMSRPPDCRRPACAHEVDWLDRVRRVSAMIPCALRGLRCLVQPHPSFFLGK